MVHFSAYLRHYFCDKMGQMTEQVDDYVFGGVIYKLTEADRDGMLRRGHTPGHSLTKMLTGEIPVTPGRFIRAGKDTGGEVEIVEIKRV